MIDAVAKLLKDDMWALAEVHAELGIGFIRYREPVLGRGQTGDYVRLLSITWAYADEDGGEQPSEEQHKEMVAFEDRLCNALERDGMAVLTAVLTFDGARQWVLYTSDVQECGRRVNDMPHGGDRYPIELTADLDPDWNYLRDDILRRVDFEQK